MKREKVPRWLRRLVIASAIVVGVVVAIRLVLDPVATHFTRKALNDADGIRGDFHSVHVTVIPPGYEIIRLKIVEHPADDWKHPLFYAERVAARLDLRELLHGRVAASARLDEPKLVFISRKDTPLHIPDVRKVLQGLMPARINRVEVRDGEVVYQDLTAPRDPKIWVHEIELAVENLATRSKLAGGRPALASGRAKLGRSGDVTMFVSANPLAPKLEFAGQMAVKGWKVAELFDLIEPATDLQTPEGTLDVFAEFTAANGRILGGVKPVAKNVKVRKLRRMVEDAGEIAALGDDSVEAAKRKAEEEALTQALKAAVAKW